MDWIKLEVNGPRPTLYQRTLFWDHHVKDYFIGSRGDDVYIIRNEALNEFEVLTKYSHYMEIQGPQ
jgi:hypothetical protein